MFNKLFCDVIDKHAPLRRRATKTNYAPWLDKEIRALMSERNTAKATANQSDCPLDWARFRKLRNTVSKLNKCKKKLYYQQKLKEAKNNSKMMWKTMNNITGRNNNALPTHIESADGFITKPEDIANYFNTFYSTKIDQLTSNMSCGDPTLSCHLIKNSVMKEKCCSFDFTIVSVDKVECLLNALPDEMSPGLDNMDGRFLKLVVKFVSRPLCHIFNRCLTCGVFPSQWKESKIIPIPKNKNTSFNGAYSKPISISILFSIYTNDLPYALD